MPTVTSENKEEFDKKELAKRSMPEPVETNVTVNNREVPVTMHPVEKRSGDIMTHINPDKFDPAFEKTDNYIGENGKGGIKNRYKEFGDFVKKADSMRASNVYIKPNGIPVFGDGRHRYAYLRDQGVKKIPMAMNKESIENAKKHGYLHED